MVKKDYSTTFCVITQIYAGMLMILSPFIKIHWLFLVMAIFMLIAASVSLLHSMGRRKESSEVFSAEGHGSKKKSFSGKTRWTYFVLHGALIFWCFVTMYVQNFR